MSNVDDILQAHDDGAILGQDDYRFNLETNQLETNELVLEADAGNAVRIRVKESTYTTSESYTLQLPPTVGATGEALALADASTGELEWISTLAPNDADINITGAPGEVAVTGGTFNVNQRVDASITISLANALRQYISPAGFYGSGATVPRFEVDEKGRILQVEELSIAAAGGFYDGTQDIVQGNLTIDHTTGEIFATPSAGVDQPGLDLVLSGGGSTGLAAGGNIVFKAAAGGASTSISANPHVELFRIRNNGVIHLPQDGQKLSLGSAYDLQLYHDGNDSYINERGTGDLIIQSSGAAVEIRDTSSTNVPMAKFVTSAGCELYHAGAKKFETTATGIAVTGSLDMLSVNLSGTTGSTTLTAATNVATYTLALPAAAGNADDALVLSSAAQLEFREVSKLRVNGATKAEAVSTGLTVDGDLAVSGIVSGVSDPVQPTDACNRRFAENLVNGLSWVQKVDLASTTGLTIGAAYTSIDGVTLSTLDDEVRLLLTAQGGAAPPTNHAENAIWVYKQSTQSWSRPADFPLDGNAANKSVFVDGGTQAGKGFTCLAPTTADRIGTNALEWAQFSSATFSTDDVTIKMTNNVLSLADDIQGNRLFSGRLVVGSALPSSFFSNFEFITQTNPAENNPSGSNTLRVAVAQTSAVASHAGGAVALCAKCTDGSDITSAMAQIAGRKTNATSGDLSGYLSIGTCLNGVMKEQMRVTDAGQLVIGVPNGEWGTDFTYPGAWSVCNVTASYVELLDVTGNLTSYPPPNVGDLVRLSGNNAKVYEISYIGTVTAVDIPSFTGNGIRFTSYAGSDLTLMLPRFGNVAVVEIGDYRGPSGLLHARSADSAMSEPLGTFESTSGNVSLLLKATDTGATAGACYAEFENAKANATSSWKLGTKDDDKFSIWQGFNGDSASNYARGLKLTAAGQLQVVAASATPSLALSRDDGVTFSTIGLEASELLVSHLQDITLSAGVDVNLNANTHADGSILGAVADNGRFRFTAKNNSIDFWGGGSGSNGYLRFTVGPAAITPALTIDEDGAMIGGNRRLRLDNGLGDYFELFKNPAGGDASITNANKIDITAGGAVELSSTHASNDDAKITIDSASDSYGAIAVYVDETTDPQLKVTKTDVKLGAGIKLALQNNSQSVNLILDAAQAGSYDLKLPTSAPTANTRLAIASDTTQIVVQNINQSPTRDAGLASGVGTALLAEDCTCVTNSANSAHKYILPLSPAGTKMTLLSNGAYRIQTDSASYTINSTTNNDVAIPANAVLVELTCLTISTGSVVNWLARAYEANGNQIAL